MAHHSPGGLILLVEDNRNISEPVGEFLESRGFEVDYAADGVDAINLATEIAFDVIVLDLMLPRLGGLEVCRRLRTEHRSTTPILMLTARDSLEEKIEGLEAGADDYLTKPFALPELEVRLEAVLARARGRRTPRTLQVHDLRLDLDTLEATRAGQLLHLYPAGRKLLEVLMLASPAAVERQQLEHALWGDAPPDGDMLRSHVYELRRSVDGPFDTKLIHTLPRYGYRLVATVGAEPAA